MNLTHYPKQSASKANLFFEPIALTYNDKDLPLDINLQQAYAAAVDPQSYPLESCRGVAHIDVKIEQNAPKSAWYLGATLIPFWPAMPVDETWNYHMETRIFCNGSLTFKGEFQESLRLKTFWYGKLRTDLANEASQEMHRKLLERLKFETRLERSTDLNSAQDF